VIVAFIALLELLNAHLFKKEAVAAINLKVSHWHLSVHFATSSNKPFGSDSIILMLVGRAFLLMSNSTMAWPPIPCSNSLSGYLSNQGSLFTRELEATLDSSLVLFLFFDSLEAQEVRVNVAAIKIHFLYIMIPKIP
jgi:hypothetical protein